MKKNIIFLSAIFLTLGLVSCHKNNNTTPETNSVLGNWYGTTAYITEDSSGVIIARDTINIQSPDSMRLDFINDSAYAINSYQQGSSNQKSGFYKITNNQLILYVDHVGGQIDEIDQLALNGNTLTITNVDSFEANGYYIHDISNNIFKRQKP